MLTILINLWILPACFGVNLTSYFSQHGLHGQISFYQDLNSTAIHVTVDLINRNEFESNQTWTWFIAEYPVDYSLIQDRCNLIGGVVADLGDLFGPISFTTNEQVYFEFETVEQELFALVGEKGIWGSSLVLTGPNRQIVCSSIIVNNEREEWVAEAKFINHIEGSVYFRWAGSAKNNVTDNLIFSNLVHLSNQSASLNNWKIYITDILDSEADKSRATCDFLQIIFNPGNKNPPVGDLSKNIGLVKVGQSRYSTTLFRDTGLSLLPADLLDGRRNLYLVLFDAKHPDSFLTCAKIRSVSPSVVKAIVQSKGVEGQVVFSQRTPYNPTTLIFNLTTQNVPLNCEIHQLPDIANCAAVGKLHGEQIMDFQSQDGFPIGDISKKHRNFEFEGEKRFWDLYLPLYGPHSIAHRSLAFYRYSDENPWVCASLIKYQSISSSSTAVPMITAKAVFRYPIVGQMFFRQPADQPLSETTVIVEMLVHADGTSVNDTMEHRWTINDNPPGRDFYNWSMRCLSAGNVYNPFKVSEKIVCSGEKPFLCSVGDLDKRLGALSIAGSIKNAERVSRKIFTVKTLPLSGRERILGKSLVIYDDFGPKARGDRLACSKIEREHRRKAVVKNWFTNGEENPVFGKIEFLQQSRYDLTNIDVSLKGLIDASKYQIHMVPVKEELQFPCEESTLYGKYNPRNLPESFPTYGTPDEFAVGDLSGKFGKLDDKVGIAASYNDSTITLFGNENIIMRSVVIHKKANKKRWVCSSIERGYAPSEARELRAIASFHHPEGFAYGYVRMTQLIYNDGSKSDTAIEVDLRYPGKNDRNLTKNHNWAVYVNPVSVDASVKVLNTRCTAGGYVWNPYYTQLADPLNEELYKTECGKNNPLRCYVGDLSARLGTISVGDKRFVFSDSNLPLEGDVSVMGRSVVVFTPDKGPERMACANILPDNDIIKYANVRSSSDFVADEFLEEFRSIMGIPDWFLTIDTRQTKSLYNRNCVQFLLHFKGPDAAKLEQDFSRLLSTGTLHAPSISIPGFVPEKRKSTTSYRECGSEDPADSSQKRKRPFFFGYNGSVKNVALCNYLFVFIIINHLL